MATSENVKTGYLKYFRLDYCFGGSHHYNISITTVASDQKSGFASYACKKTYNGGICNVKTPYRDISGGSVNFIEMGLDGPQEYGPVQVIVRGDGRFGEYNNFTIAGSVPYWLLRPAAVTISYFLLIYVSSYQPFHFFYKRHTLQTHRWCDTA